MIYYYKLIYQLISLIFYSHLACYSQVQNTHFPSRIPTRYSKTFLAQGSGGYAVPLYILLINAETL